MAKVLLEDHRVESLSVATCYEMERCLADPREHPTDVGQDKYSLVVGCKFSEADHLEEIVVIEHIPTDGLGERLHPCQLGNWPESNEQVQRILKELRLLDHTVESGGGSLGVADQGELLIGFK